MKLEHVVRAECDDGMDPAYPQSTREAWAAIVVEKYEKRMGRDVVTALVREVMGIEVPPPKPPEPAPVIAAPDPEDDPPTQHSVFDGLVGKTIVQVYGREHDREMRFVFSDGKVCRFFHAQDCCESVRIEEIHGDLRDLIEAPLLLAEEATQAATGVSESGTWTFYRFATHRGHVTVRWLGESNGYYSETVEAEISDLPVCRRCKGSGVES